MLITAIKQMHDKKRNYIYIDGEIAFVLYKGDLRKYALIEGEQMDSDVYETIISETLNKRAYLRTVHLLEKKDYSVYQLKCKLKDSYYPERVIEYVIERLSEYGFVDDKRFAYNYIESCSKSKSRREIMRKLFEKGIDRRVVENVYAEYDADSDGNKEIELINKILIKRHFFEKPHDHKECAKQYKYLLSKGFSSSDISKVLKLDITL